MKTASQRVAEALRKKNMTIAQFARITGVQDATLRKQLDRNSSIKMHHLEAYSKALGVSIEYLLTGIDQGPGESNMGKIRCLSDLPKIPFYELQRVSAGKGIDFEYDKPIGMRSITPEFLEMAKGKLCMIRAEGSSMEPLIMNGAELIVDFMPITEPRPGIHVIQVDNQLCVKDIEMLPGRVMMVRSRNPDYPDKIFDEETSITVRVLGRVLGQQQMFW